MRFFILLTFFAFTSVAAEKAYVLKDYDKTPKTLAQVKRLAVKYPRNNLVGNLHRLLIAGRPSRFIGSEGHQKAREQILASLEKIAPSNKAVVEEFTPDVEALKKSYQADFDTYLKSGVAPASDEAVRMRLFTESMITLLNHVKGVKGQNIIWEKKGFIQPDEVLIIGVHYDTLARDPEKFTVSWSGNMPGADNNGSGVATALALIEVLEQVNIAKTIRVIFFDGEELGQSGSSAYVEAHREELSKQKLAGFINLLMLGHDTTREDKINKSGNMRFYVRSSAKDESGAVKDEVLAKLLASLGEKVRPAVEFTPTQRDGLMSSQVAFQTLGIPSIVMTHDWENDMNTSHHTKQDFAETLNFSTFHNAAQYLIGAVLAWSFDMR